MGFLNLYREQVRTKMDNPNTGSKALSPGELVTIYNNSAKCHHNLQIDWTL